MNAQIEKLELVRLLLDTDDKEILKAVKSLLNQKRNKKMDETTYLMSSEANKKHLLKGMKEVEDGKTTPVTLENLWK